MYATKYVSGGHINPAVSFAAMISGHIDWLRGLAYIGAQILGALFGASVQAWLSPDNAFGKTGPGCFSPVSGLSNWGLFGWEFCMTTIFIVVMYAAIFVRPGHGDASPLAAAVMLFGALSTGGMYTGFSPLNPARVIAGSTIFRCFWRYCAVYVTAHLLAACAAAAYALLAFGKGPFYRRGETATGTLREGLLGEGAEEPMGPVSETFAPTGHHYAGSVPVDVTGTRT